MRRDAGFLLLVFGVASMMTGVGSAETALSPRVVATYFHRTLRCQTCLNIESLARYDATVLLADDLESGRLIWRSLNFEEEENAGFEDQFALDGPTVVVTLEARGKVLKWVRLDRVWEIEDDTEAFDKYVTGAIEEYLLAASQMTKSEESSQ